MGLSTTVVWTDRFSGPQDGSVPENPKAFGRRLAKSRVAAGFDSQRELAARLKVSHTAVGYWEAGTHLPKPRQVRTLAKLLDDPKLLELAGLADDRAPSDAQRLDELERLFADVVEGQSTQEQTLSQLADEIAWIRRQLGRS